MVRAVVLAKAVPPVDTLYHWIAVPVAERFATVGLFIAQKDCDADPVGAAGLPMVTATAKRVADWHPLTVCDA